MTQNDYIAEYIKEKYPSLLGAGFAIWKLSRTFVKAAQNITDALRGADWSKIAQKLNEIEETEDADSN